METQMIGSMNALFCGVWVNQDGLRFVDNGCTPKTTTQAAIEAGCKAGDLIECIESQYGVTTRNRYKLVATPWDDRAYGFWVEALPRAEKLSPVQKVLKDIEARRAVEIR